jgi:DNA-binding HxlR family transcriptional regulator
MGRITVTTRAVLINAPRGTRMGETDFAETDTEAGNVPVIAKTCPLHLAINAIEGRWKLHILRALFVYGAQRYNVLLRNVAQISAKELTRNLRELEQAKLVLRKTEEGEQRYGLTSLGKELLPTFQSLGRFGVMLAESKSGPQRG